MARCRAAGGMQGYEAVILRLDTLGEGHILFVKFL
jgi:hypothetical protein